MTTLAEKLTRLGRQAGKEICSEQISAPELPRAAPTPRAEICSEQISRSPLPEELRRLLGIRLRDPATLGAPRPRRPVDRSLPGDEIAPGLRYLESTHAAPALAPSLDCSFAKDFTHVDPAHLLAFDTETTGLAGGTGTRAFMIGAADLTGDGRLRVRQLLTTTMAAETAMLRTFAGWLHARTVLLSYNGRSYDGPLLKTRYRLARLPCAITPLAHLDLLHPARRRWRGVYENCRLATIERRVLQVLREDDLPGSEAPRAWRDYLQGGDARDLRRVLEHNHTDVRSLVALLAHMVRAGAQERDSPPD